MEDGSWRKGKSHDAAGASPAAALDLSSVRSGAGSASILNRAPEAQAQSSCPPVLLPFWRTEVQSRHTMGSRCRTRCLAGGLAPTATATATATETETETETSRCLG